MTDHAESCECCIPAAAFDWLDELLGQPEMLTVVAAAEVVGTTVRTVRRWLADGRLPAYRRDGRVYVFEVDLWAVEVATRRKGGKPRRCLTPGRVVIP